MVFQLFELDNETLQQASQDNEEQQQRYRRRAVRNTLRLPRGLFRLLTGSLDDDEDDEDTAHNLAVRQQSNLSQQHGIFDATDDDEIEVNLREDWRRCVFGSEIQRSENCPSINSNPPSRPSHVSSKFLSMDM